MRRRLAGLALTAALLGSAVPAGAAVKLTVWVQQQDLFDQVKWIAQQYQKEHPDVSFDMQFISVSQADYSAKIGLAVASGAPPDITWLEGSTPREMAAKGLFLPVDDALRGLRFTPADVTEMTYKGKMYAAPYFTTTRGLLKRVDAFNDSGLDANANPSSMEQFKAWSDKLTVRNSDGTYKRVGFIPWGTNWGAPGWMWSFGGQLVDASGIHPTATDPNNVRAFEWLREWAQPFNGKSPVPAGAGGFQNGTIAMNTDSTSAVGRLVNAKVNFTTGPVPHDAAGSNGTWGGGQAFAIPVNAAHPVEAMQFLRYMNTPEVQIARFKQFPQLLPANWDALQAIAPELPAVYGPMLAQFPEARARTPLWIDYYVNQLRPAVTAVITGKKTPQQALADVQQVMVQRYKEVFGE